MFDPQNRFVIKNYQSKPTFSSFLPGIAGPTGVPVWCYYNNRGQAVCSFGVSDKDHSIMDFSSAHSACQTVKYTGFRTFAKCDGVYRELFTDNCDMHIGMSEVEIRSSCDTLLAEAVYFGVPGERTAALARMLTITARKAVELELLDGMSAVVCFGLKQDMLKNLPNLAKAWMQAEDASLGRTYFRVRASTEDSAAVREVTGGNFCLAWDDTGALLKPLVQPSLVFGQDTSLTTAEVFRKTPLEELCGKTQVTSNIFPCCFLPRKTVLQPGESIHIFSLYGQAECKEQVRSLAEAIRPESWFAAKRREAETLVRELCAPIQARTADPVFDAYAKQSYLDNLLRGGSPMFFRDGEKAAPFYLYSRKHGDPEREYNYFSLGREYYAQGNGNYRDVNQNRRSDVLFCPELGAENIHTFFDLIQSDGYNPLVVLPSTYRLRQESRDLFPEITGEFTPGRIAMAAQDRGLSPKEIREYTAKAVCAADSEPNASFGEGYWCDHWTYNLDLIESYLGVYPERKEALLFESPRYRWFDTQVLVNPRAKRCCVTENGLRQYHALDEHPDKPRRKWMQTESGAEARSTLIEKLVLLCTIKTATLDAAGMGVEMEGGRPGWYDALNGLPGIFGSSMAESCELARLLSFTAGALERRNGSVELYREIASLLADISGAMLEESDALGRWNRTNEIKEAYRAATMKGFRGEKQRVSCLAAAASLRAMENVVLQGIQKAIRFNGGLIPTYFSFTVESWEDTPEGPLPTALTPKALPLFLEGAVRYYKLSLPPEEKRELARRVRESGLYDRKLNMYKVNESLAGVSYEAGRALAFTPGWLENESVWLHMEYKYLLELLKNGLYEEFSQAFRNAAVPFLDPDTYGRSPLENSSFIASSANPDPESHGRGFVARLSGSTAEFVHMWQLMFFGKEPFRLEKDALTLELRPFIPEYLMPENGTVEATFLGHIPVTYHAPGKTALVPGKTHPACYALTQADGTVKTVSARALSQEDALAVRSGKITAITVTME